MPYILEGTQMKSIITFIFPQVFKETILWIES